jgi:hypothetical protein
MPALNLDLNYFEHPKTKRLIGLLGPGAEVYPLRLWVYCGKYHHKDGDLSSYTEGEIESVSGWTGHPGRMLQAMLTVGFLEQTPDGLIVHDWQDHAGHFAAYHERAKMAAKQRWNGHQRASSIAPSNAKRGGQALLEHVTNDASRNAPAGQGRASNRGATFVPPTLDEVSAEVASKGYRLDPSRFINFYEAKGWMVGKNKMVSWKAALANWNATNGAKPTTTVSAEENERLRAAARGC